MLRAFFLLRTSLFAAAWKPKASSATAWFGECWRFGSAGGIEVGEINKMVGTVDETELNLQLDETFIAGEKVKVIEGPFNGFSGVIQEVMQEKHKLRVVVTIFDRQTPLELSFSQVDKE